MGFYDRFLAQPEFIGVSCGLAFEEQIIDDVPVLDHDMPLSMLVTDRGIRRFASQCIAKSSDSSSHGHLARSCHGNSENMEVLMARHTRKRNHTRISRPLIAVLGVTMAVGGERLPSQHQRNAQRREADRAHVAQGG